MRTSPISSIRSRCDFLWYANLDVCQFVRVSSLQLSAFSMLGSLMSNLNSIVFKFSARIGASRIGHRIEWNTQARRETAILIHKRAHISSFVSFFFAIFIERIISKWILFLLLNLHAAASARRRRCRRKILSAQNTRSAGSCSRCRIRTLPGTIVTDKWTNENGRYQVVSLGRLCVLDGQFRTATGHWGDAILSK